MENYNFLEKLYHKIIFANDFFIKSFYEIEKIFFLKNIEIKNKKHVFISGLPRSGTTTLLNFLYQTNEYASLKYRNMPLILSPNISLLFKSKNLKTSERLHGDGINFNLDSPESFDEVFFNNNEKFIKKELLNFLKIVVISEKTKYLSKNNLNFKRIGLIKSILPNAIFLIPFRDPLNQSISLLNQHRKFCLLQSKDKFIEDYMNFLGHNEFGNNHISWKKNIKYSDFNTLDYWIEQWYHFYKDIYIKHKNTKNIFFINYEKLVNTNYVDEIKKIIDIKFEININYFINSKYEHNKEEYDFKNLKNAKSIFYKLSEKMSN